MTFLLAHKPIRTTKRSKAWFGTPNRAPKPTFSVCTVQSVPDVLSRLVALVLQVGPCCHAQLVLWSDNAPSDPSHAHHSRLPCCLQAAASSNTAASGEFLQRLYSPPMIIRINELFRFPIRWQWFYVNLKLNWSIVILINPSGCVLPRDEVCFSPCSCTPRLFDLLYRSAQQDEATGKTKPRLLVCPCRVWRRPFHIYFVSPSWR